MIAGAIEARQPRQSVAVRRGVSEGWLKTTSNARKRREGQENGQPGQAGRCRGSASSGVQPPVLHPEPA